MSEQRCRKGKNLILFTSVWKAWFKASLVIQMFFRYDYSWFGRRSDWLNVTKVQFKLTNTHTVSKVAYLAYNSTNTRKICLSSYLCNKQTMWFLLWYFLFFIFQSSYKNTRKLLKYIRNVRECAKPQINDEQIWEDGPRPENAVMLQKGKQEALDERARFQKSYKTLK